MYRAPQTRALADEARELLRSQREMAKLRAQGHTLPPGPLELGSARLLYGFAFGLGIPTPLPLEGVRPSLLLPGG